MEPNTLLFLSIAALMVASPEHDADKALLKAYYRQSGLDRDFKRFEKKEVPEEARIYLGYAAYISKTFVDKKIVIQWRFP